MARKSYDDAVTYYYRALKQTNSTNAVLWNKLGIAYQQMENFQAARKAYSQSIRHKRDYSEPLNNLGTTWFMQDKYGKSVKYYLKAIKLDPNSASYHLNLGTSYFHLKKDKEFFEEYAKALDLNPNISPNAPPLARYCRLVGPTPITIFTWRKFLLAEVTSRKPCATFAVLSRTGLKIVSGYSTIRIL